MAVPDSRYEAKKVQQGQHRGKYVLVRRWASGKTKMIGLYEDKQRALKAARTLNSAGEETPT